jgi:23S rRNA (cytosine1962-C5)-methyltransferase
MLCFGKEEPRASLIQQRIAEAIEHRGASPLLADTDAVRLINAEGDGLPGLVVDRYADTLVVKFASPGMARRRDSVVAALKEATHARLGFERADPTLSRREGMPVEQGPLWGEAPRDPVEICERGRRYAVDIAAGQKTCFYLDQRDARDLVQSLAAGRRMLDLFAYTGGFAVAAAVGGAGAVTLVESSQAALEMANSNLEKNRVNCEVECVRGDAFRYLRPSTASSPPGDRFDLVVIDPPPLARRKRDVERATRAYKDLLLFALRAAAPDALVLAFACSHHVGPDLFRKVCFGASLDAGRSLKVLRELGAAADHPVSIDHPEGVYLTGLLLQV